MKRVIRRLGLLLVVAGTGLALWRGVSEPAGPSFAGVLAGSSPQKHRSETPVQTPA